MPDDRLDPAAWIEAGLEALRQSGPSSLKADTLAKHLKVSRGSFYWHFADVAAFHEAVLRRWRETALEAIVEEIDAGVGDRIDALLARAFHNDPRTEIAIRAWALADPLARTNADAVDAARIAYVRSLLLDIGIPAGLASARAQLLNWAYLGHALSKSRPSRVALRVVLNDLSQLARSAAPKQVHGTS